MIQRFNLFVSHVIQKVSEPGGYATADDAKTSTVDPPDDSASIAVANRKRGQRMPSGAFVGIDPTTHTGILHHCARV